MWSHHFISIILFFLCCNNRVDAFTLNRRIVTGLDTNKIPSQGICSPPQNICSFRQAQQYGQQKQQESTALYSSKYDGTGDRGLVILGVVLAACVWIFTIPPYFRRVSICWINGDFCAQNRDKEYQYCADCVTFDEWKAGILQYYRNGGGVNFDFSIDSDKKAATAEFFRNYKPEE